MLTDYKLKEWLSITASQLLGRACHQGSKMNVLVKFLLLKDATALSTARFQQECLIFQALRAAGGPFPGIARQQTQASAEGVRAIVLDNFTGSSLDVVLAAGRMDISIGLQVACNLAEALMHLHDCRIIHGALRPASILVNLPQGSVCIVDFGLATMQDGGAQWSLVRGNISDDEWAYLSPEQFANSNSEIDCRTDFYSLGVTLYQILSGALPFHGKEPLEWMHRHSARFARPLAELCPDVPKVLTDIVMKLMAKEPKDRYQSARGLLSDLELCRSQWMARKMVDVFALDASQTAGKPQVSDPLLYRRGEARVLQEAFDRVSESGKAELVLISGGVGSGKSALVLEMQRRIPIGCHYFAAVKFSQSQSGMPFAAIIHAVGEWLDHLSGESEQVLHSWRDQVFGALGVNARILNDAIPKFQLILGDCPPVPVLPPLESRNRLYWVLRKFLGLFARAGHPLIMFLDDLHLADAASLALFQHLATHPETRHVVFVGTYRTDQAITSSPRWNAMIGAVANVLPLQEVRLAPLDLPFLISGQFNVESQGVLMTAACIGPRFELRTLASITGRSAIQLANFLEPAVRMDILRLACEHGSESEADVFALQHHEDANRVYFWRHDHFQQAAYSLLPQDTRLDAHLRIGRLLLSNALGDRIVRDSFEILRHLNLGARLITDPPERIRVAELNLAAGRLANRMAAHDAGLQHANTALQLLGPDAWADHYRLTLDLHHVLCESLHLLGDSRESQAVVDRALSHCSSDSDRASLFQMKVRFAASVNDFAGVLEAGLIALRLSGIDVPAEVEPTTMPAAWDDFLCLADRLDALDMNTLLAQPVIENDANKATADCLGEVIEAAYATRCDMTLNLATASIEWSLKYGHCGASAYCYSWFGLLLRQHCEDDRRAYAFSQLAQRLVEHLPSPEAIAKVDAIGASFFGVWVEPLESVVQSLRRAHAQGMAHGDILHGGAALTMAARYSLARGEHLDHVADMLATAMTPIRHNAYGMMRPTAESAMRLVRTLQGRQNLERSIASQAAVDEVLARVGGRIDPGAMVECITELIRCVFFGCFDDGARVAANCHPAVIDAYFMAEFIFYGALVDAARHEQCSQAERQEVLQRVEASLRRIEKWSKRCPANFSSMQLLLDAELARLAENWPHAMTSYDGAIAAAITHGAIHIEALANETAARFYRRRGFDTIADAYLRKAHSGYLRWGAAGKARQIESHYPLIVEPAFRADLAQMDIGAVIRASQAISEHLELNALLEALMRAAMACAGAQNGYLLLINENVLTLAAVAEVDRQNLEVRVTNDPVTRDGLLPESIVNEVRRTGERVVWSDAQVPNPYLVDEYFLQGVAAKSICCLPIVRDRKVIGLLHLENNLHSEAFTQARLAALELLVSQSAISLNNVSICDELREREARIQHLTNSNLIGVVYGDASGLVTQANDAFLKIVGYTREDLSAGKLNVFNLTAPEYIDAVMDQYRLIKTVAGSTYEKVYVRKDGSLVPVMVMSALFKGSKTTGMGFVVDMSEQKRASAEHAARQLADAANKAKSTFLANMSHELRTPLNAILGFSRMLQRCALPRGANEDLAIIVRSSEHLHMLINQVLDLSKIEAGRMTLDESDFDLFQLREDLEYMFFPEAQKQGLEFFARCDATTPRYVRTDGTKIRQVLINLLANAFKFTKKGSVTLQIGVLPNDDGEKNLRLACAVRDTGVGIEVAELTQVGQAFVQAQAGREAKEGTGLGLAISRGFVQLMGGDLILESQIGKGTTARFEITAGLVTPSLKTDDKKRNLGVVGVMPGQPRYRILVSDDHADARQLVIRLLAPLGFDLKEAVDGEDAVFQCQAWRPHLVWMDMRMPRMDGCTATRQIKTLVPPPVVIALTASSFDEDREGILAAGCDDFLRKPFDEDEFFSLLHKHLGVRFRYMESPSSIVPTTPIDIAILSQELKDRLQCALEGLDANEVSEVIEKIGGHNVEISAFLMSLARDFKYDQILRLLAVGPADRKLDSGKDC